MADHIQPLITEPEVGTLSTVMQVLSSVRPVPFLAGEKSGLILAYV